MINCQPSNPNASIPLFKDAPSSKSVPENCIAKSAEKAFGFLRKSIDHVTRKTENKTLGSPALWNRVSPVNPERGLRYYEFVGGEQKWPALEPDPNTKRARHPIFHSSAHPTDIQTFAYESLRIQYLPDFLSRESLLDQLPFDSSIRSFLKKLSPQDELHPQLESFLKRHPLDIFKEESPSLKRMMASSYILHKLGFRYIADADRKLLTLPTIPEFNKRWAFVQEDMELIGIDLPDFILGSCEDFLPDLAFVERGLTCDAVWADGAEEVHDGIYHVINTIEFMISCPQYKTKKEQAAKEVAPLCDRIKALKSNGTLRDEAEIDDQMIEMLEVAIGYFADILSNARDVRDFDRYRDTLSTAPQRIFIPIAPQKTFIEKRFGSFPTRERLEKLDRIWECVFYDQTLGSIKY